MYCNKCGKEIDDGVKFCTYCGNSVALERTSKTEAQPKNKVNTVMILMIVVIIVGVLFIINLFTSDRTETTENINGVVSENTFLDESNDTSMDVKIDVPVEWDSNSSINANAAESIAFTGKKYYYVNAGSLHCAKNKSSDLKQVNNVPNMMRNLNIVDKKLYYSNDDGICVYDTKSEKETVLSDMIPDFICVYKDYIYCTVESETSENSLENSIYRMKLDGSDSVCIKADYIDSLSSLTIYNDYIFFVDSKEQNLNRMTLDGQQCEIIVQGELSDLNSVYIVDGYIYYCRVVDTFRWGSSDCRLYRSKLDGTEETQITFVNTGDYFVHNDMVYYEGYKDWDISGSKVSLCCISINGTNDKIIEDMQYHGYMDFSVTGDWLIYRTSLEISSGNTTSYDYSYHYLDMNTKVINQFNGI